MHEIIYIPKTSSTNDYLKELLSENGLAEGTIVCTSFQTKGKGQRGNLWESAKGENLLFSIVLYPSFIPANEQFIITQLISVAVKEFLDKQIEDVTIKWPNDIYWKDKKLGGILIENTLIDNGIECSVIGIGLNINQTKFRSDAPNPVSLKKITGHDYDLETIVKIVRDNILHNYQIIKDGNGQSILQKYTQSLFRSKGFHLYHDGICDFLAKLKDVESSGILVLETIDGEERKFAFKEVKCIL